MIKKYYLLFLINLLLITSCFVQALSRDYNTASIIEKIDFKKIDDSGQIVVKLSNVNTPFQITKSNVNQLLIELPNAYNKLASGLDVSNADTPIKIIKVIVKKKQTLITIQTQKEFIYHYIHLDNELRIITTPDSHLQHKQQYILNISHQQTNLHNILIKSIDYNKKVLLTNNVPNPQLTIAALALKKYILETLLNKYNLIQTIQDNYIFVSEIDAPHLEAQFVKKIYHLKYIKPYFLVNLLRRTHAVSSDNIQVNNSTNSITAIFPKGKQKILKFLDSFIKKYDKPTKQIQVQTIVIETTSKLLSELLAKLKVTDDLYVSLTKQAELDRIRLIAKPKVIAWDNEEVIIIRNYYEGYCCTCENLPATPLSLIITPKILTNNQIHLTIKASYSYKNPYFNSQQTSIKITNSNKAVLVDLPASPLDKDHKIIVIFIEPSFITQASN